MTGHDVCLMFAIFCILIPVDFNEYKSTLEKMHIIGQLNKPFFMLFGSYDVSTF